MNVCRVLCTAPLLPSARCIFYSKLTRTFNSSNDSRTLLKFSNLNYIEKGTFLGKRQGRRSVVSRIRTLNPTKALMFLNLQIRVDRKFGGFILKKKKSLGKYEIKQIIRSTSNYH